MNFLRNLFKRTYIDESFEDQAKEAQIWIDEIILKHPEQKEYPFIRNGCDTIVGGKGEFGRCPDNPIPVNGPKGELKYLSMLRPSVFFHRLGSIKSVVHRRVIDIYELVSRHGNQWDILYFDIYYARRSTKAPKGYKLNAYHKIFCHPALVAGTNKFDRAFPHALPDIVREM